MKQIKSSFIQFRSALLRNQQWDCLKMSNKNQKYVITNSFILASYVNNNSVLRGIKFEELDWDRLFSDRAQGRLSHGQVPVCVCISSLDMFQIRMCPRKTQIRIQPFQLAPERKHARNNNKLKVSSKWIFCLLRNFETHSKLIFYILSMLHPNIFSIYVSTTDCPIPHKRLNYL